MCLLSALRTSVNFEGLHPYIELFMCGVQWVAAAKVASSVATCSKIV